MGSRIGKTLLQFIVGEDVNANREMSALHKAIACIAAIFGVVVLASTFFAEDISPRVPLLLVTIIILLSVSPMYAATWRSRMRMTAHLICVMALAITSVGVIKTAGDVSEWQVAFERISDPESNIDAKIAQFHERHDAGKITTRKAVEIPDGGSLDAVIMEAAHVSTISKTVAVVMGGSEMWQVADDPFKVLADATSLVVVSVIDGGVKADPTDVAAIMCAVGPHGTVAAVNALPIGGFMDVKNLPQFAPLVDICRGYAHGGPIAEIGPV